jgi:hypothetical protein
MIKLLARGSTNGRAPGRPCHDLSMAPQRTKQPQPVSVYLERGAHRTFALAVDWPGWARSARDDEAALEALAQYLPRYETALRAAGQQGPATGPDGPRFTVVERVAGNATTDFGAPGVVPALDTGQWPADVAERQAALVAACWARVDVVAANAPAQLRKGPRGGGRDRDAVVEHVLNAELAYARKIGVKVAAPKDDEAVREYRRRLLAALRDPAVAPAPSERAKGWPVAYAARRIGWHALDHAWEIEDRSDLPG